MPTFKGLYVNDFNTILGNLNSENSLISFAVNRGFNSLYLYDLTGILSTSLGRTSVRDFNSRARLSGITSIAGIGGSYQTLVGTGTTGNNSRLQFNTGSTTQQKFDTFNIENEFWNYPANGDVPYSIYRTYLTGVNSVTSSSGISFNAYIGLIRDNTSTYTPIQIANDIVNYTDSISLTCYVTSQQFTGGSTNYGITTIDEELDLLGQAALSANTTVDLRIIFNAKSTFMGSYFTNVDQSFNSVYTNFYNAFSSWSATSIYSSGLTLNGYMIYGYREISGITLPPTPTPTKTPAQSPPPSNSPTPTPTKTKTPTPTITPTKTKTPSVTPTKSSTPTLNPNVTNTQTPTNTITPTKTPAMSPPPSNSPTPTKTNTPTPTKTVTVSSTPAETPPPTNSPTSSVTKTPGLSQSNTPTNTPTPSVTKTVTPFITQTPTKTQTPTVSNTPQETPPPSNSVTPTKTKTPTPTLTSSITKTPASTPPPSNTPTNTPTKSNTPTPSITKTQSQTPSITPTKSLTATNTPTKSKTPTPNVTPTISKTAAATPPPSNSPTSSVTKTPSVTPTKTVTRTPIQSPPPIN